MLITSLLNNLFLLLLLIYLVWTLVTEPDPAKPKIKKFKSIVSLKENPKIPKVEDEFPPEFANIDKGPVIGVLTMPCPVVDHIPGTAVIPASYVKWLESAGAVVVPVPFHVSKAKLEVFFNNINGLVITGGRALLWKEIKEEIQKDENIDNAADDANAGNGDDEKVNIDNPDIGDGNGDDKDGDDLQTGNTTMSESNYNSTDDITPIPVKRKRYRRTTFAKSISNFIKMALAASKQKDYFPILGICLGMEGIILHFERNLNNMKYLRKVNLTKRDYIEGAGIFTKKAPDSRLYGSFKGNLQDLTERVFYYHHQYGLNYNNIVKNFDGGIEVLSFFYDNNKDRYVTSFEFTNHPIFGIQYHPEKAAYEWKIKMNRTQVAQRVSTDIAFNFVEECKKNSHVFNYSKFQNLLIYHFNSTDHSSIYNQIYKIPYSYHNTFKYGINAKKVINSPNATLEDQAPVENNTTLPANDTIIENNNIVPNEIIVGNDGLPVDNAPNNDANLLVGPEVNLTVEKVDFKQQ